MIKHTSIPDRWDVETDLVAAGASSGGLTAVIMGHDLGLSTLLIEKSEYFGGGTALSGGVLWVPCNHVMQQRGLSDSREEALEHIRRVSLGRHEEALLAAYLDNGPDALRYLEEHSPLKLTTGLLQGTDYYADLPGGKELGRQVYADPEVMIPILTEAQTKYPSMSKVRPDPIPYLVGIRDYWEEGRGLIGSLVLACVERGIDMRTGIRARELIVDSGRVIGLRAETEGCDLFIRARKGVLLACGGYEWNSEMNKRFMNAPDLVAYTPTSNEGDGHVMGMEVGAAIALMDHSIFQPVFHVHGEDVDGKPFYRVPAYGYPGNIIVNRYGKRCCNESFYPDIGRAFVEYDKLDSEMANVPLYWIADHAFAKRGGILGMATFTPNSDWLYKAETLEGLAEQLGIPGGNLANAVERFNEHARNGQDPDFRRGEMTYQQWWGTRFHPDLKPSTLGPLEQPPFYGIKLQPGTVGNLGGLVTNADAQVIDVHGGVIPGLYGTSNTTALLTYGFSYTSGACQAKSLIFGYIAARHMAQTGC